MVHSSLIGPRQQQHPQPKNIAKNGEEKESVLKQQQQQKQQQLKVSFVTGNSMKVRFCAYRKTKQMLVCVFSVCVCVCVFKSDLNIPTLKWSRVSH